MKDARSQKVKQAGEPRSPGQPRAAVPTQALLSFLFRPGDGDGLACLAHFETGEAAHRDVLTQLADLGGDE